MEIGKSRKYYRRNNFSNNTSQDIENSKCNNNYQNSLISKIIKKNEGLKNFTVGNKNINNINTIKSNIKTIFSTDERKLKAIKYIIKSRKDNRKLSPSYKYRNIESFPQIGKNRENRKISPKKEVIDNSDLHNKDNNNDDKEIKHIRTISYNKRHISQLSSDSFLFDQTDNYNADHINQNASVEKTSRKYNKRIIIRENSKSNNIINNKKIIENNLNTISSILNKHNININNNKLNDFNKINSELNSTDNNLKNEEEKNCLNISFAEEGNFIQNEKIDTTEIGNNNNKDNYNEENNKLLAINSHEISFRSFKNENNENNSNNNSFDLKELTIDNNLNKNRIKLFKSLENAFSIYSNINYPLKFKSEKEIINYFKNGHIKIDKKPLTLIKDEELKNLNEKNKENENIIKKINKENELYVNELSKLQKEIDLLRQKLDEVYYAYQEIYKAYSSLKKQNTKRNSFSKEVKKKQKENKNEGNYKLSNKNNKKEILLENNEIKKDIKNDNGLISKTMFKFMNFFNEKKNKSDE